MNKKINVLVFPCGSENALEIHIALKDIVNIELFGASSVDNHGQFIFKNYTNKIPFITEYNFIEKLIKIIDENKIDIIFPTHDDVVLKLAENKHNIPCKIAIAGFNQANICRSKKLIYNLFKNEAFCPIVYENLESIKAFPVFVKPDKGQGGKNSYIINNSSHVNMFVHDLKNDYVITEYLPGNELTVDCFSNYKNELVFVGPRTRERIFSGISVHSKTIPIDDNLMQIANIINEKIKMDGLWYFQLKKSIDNVYKLLEISIRVSGTMNLYRNIGINFPLLTIYNLYKMDTILLQNNYKIEVDRALYNRYKINFYYEYIYIDFDDTITKNNKVNPFVLFFLYNAKNLEKKIILITKHEFNITETLNSLKIHIHLFDQIIHLKPTDEKYLYIKEITNAIFIDNSFHERLKISTKLKIPVFDVDAINSLIDYKE